MTRRKRYLTLVGESLRDFGVLVVVFVPLEAAAHGSLTWIYIGLTLVGVESAFCLGLRLEVNRQ